MESQQRYRKENDPLGEVLLPINAYYGAQTQRAVDNF
jgi:aspartate ammonia-lyase